MTMRPSSSAALNGKSIRLTRSDLKKLPRTELEAVDHRGHKARYSGVALRALLDKLNVPHGEAVRGEWMRAFVFGGGGRRISGDFRSGRT